MSLPVKGFCKSCWSFPQPIRHYAHHPRLFMGTFAPRRMALPPAQRAPLKQSGRSLFRLCRPSHVTDDESKAFSFPLDQTRRRTETTPEPIPSVFPGGAFRGWTNVSPAIRRAAAGEPDVIADQASDWLFSQAVVEITPTTLCKNHAEKSAPVLHPATRNILDFVRHCRFAWSHVWASQCHADQSLDRRYRTSRLAASRRAE